LRYNNSFLKLESLKDQNDITSFSGHFKKHLEKITTSFTKVFKNHFGKHESSKIFGTANYISPEIILGTKGIKGESDYWALGVILYYMYTKVFPFKGDSVEALFDDILYGEVNWNLLENTDINKDLIPIIKGFLQYDHEKRLTEFDKIKEMDYFKSNKLLFITYNLFLLI